MRNKKKLILLFCLFTLTNCTKNFEYSLYNTETDYFDNQLEFYEDDKSKFVARYNKNNNETIVIYSKETLDMKKQTIQNLNTDTSIINRLNKSDFLNIFGTPNLIKKQPNIELWQYKNNYCISDIFWNKNEILQIISYNLQLQKITNISCINYTINNSKNNDITNQDALDFTQK